MGNTEGLLQVHQQQEEGSGNDKWGRDIVKKDLEKTKLLHAFFTSVSPGKA